MSLPVKLPELDVPKAILFTLFFVTNIISSPTPSSEHYFSSQQQNEPSLLAHTPVDPLHYTIDKDNIDTSLTTCSSIFKQVNQIKSNFICHIHMVSRC
jgi:hypothetical protein